MALLTPIKPSQFYVAGTKGDSKVRWYRENTSVLTEIDSTRLEILEALHNNHQTRS